MIKKRIYLYISLLVILTCFLRFNRQDILINKITHGELIGDHIHYYKLVTVFRNSQSIDLVQAPFNSRILPSLIASFLPFPENFSLNLINVFFLILGNILIFKALVKINIDQKIAFLTTCLYILSFPVFYYGAIGYIEPVLISFYMIGIYYLLKENYLKLTFVIFFGVFVKETIFILVLVSIIFAFLTREKSKNIILSILFSYLIGFAILKFYLYNNTNQSYQWIPTIENALSNLSRSRTYFTFLISIFPLAISFIPNLIFKNKKFSLKKQLLERNRFIITFGFGIILSFSIFIYSIFSAYTDGRFIWLSYPYSIVLTGFLLNNNDKLKDIAFNLETHNVA